MGRQPNGRGLSRQPASLPRSPCQPSTDVQSPICPTKNNTRSSPSRTYGQAAAVVLPRPPRAAGQAEWPAISYYTAQLCTPGRAGTLLSPTGAVRWAGWPASPNQPTGVCTPGRTGSQRVSEDYIYALLRNAHPYPARTLHPRDPQVTFRGPTRRNGISR